MKTSHLNALRALEAALRTGNFRSAAAELGVTPAAVGQLVRGLEGYLGRQLFLRTPAGVVPTAAAKRISASLTSSFAGIGNVLTDLKRDRPASRLSLTMTQAFGEYWLTSRLSGFYALGDQVDLRIDTTDVLVDLTGDEFDFAIRFGPPPHGPLEGFSLFAGCVVPVCTPEFASRYQLSTGTTSLEGVPVIHVRDETTDPTWLTWTTWSAKFGIAYRERSAAPEFTKLSSGLRVAKAGLGVVLCGMLESYASLADGSLVIPFGAHTASFTDYQYWLVSARGRARSKMQNRFKSWMLDRAQEHRKSVEAMVGRQPEEKTDRAVRPRPPPAGRWPDWRTRPQAGKDFPVPSRWSGPPDRK